MNAQTGNPGIDPITLEVVRNKVEGIANEMQSTLLRSSFSTVVKEGSQRGLILALAIDNLSNVIEEGWQMVFRPLATASGKGIEADE
ncbi:hypothetical protein C2W62_51730, partial [Candidatus Entotheonella serta]